MDIKWVLCILVLIEVVLIAAWVWDLRSMVKQLYREEIEKCSDETEESKRYRRELNLDPFKNIREAGQKEHTLEDFKVFENLRFKEPSLEDYDGKHLENYFEDEAPRFQTEKFEMGVNPYEDKGESSVGITVFQGKAIIGGVEMSTEDLSYGVSHDEYGNPVIEVKKSSASH